MLNGAAPLSGSLGSVVLISSGREATLLPIDKTEPRGAAVGTGFEILVAEIQAAQQKSGKKGGSRSLDVRLVRWVLKWRLLDLAPALGWWRWHSGVEKGFEVIDESGRWEVTSGRRQGIRWVDSGEPRRALGSGTDVTPHLIKARKGS